MLLPTTTSRGVMARVHAVAQGGPRGACPSESSERPMMVPMNDADGDGRIDSKFHENTTIYSY